MLIRMAWRNLWRSRRRTAITLFSVGFGMWLAASFTALTDGYHLNMIDSSARLGFGHATVEQVNYRDAPGFDRWIVDAESAAGVAEESPEVERTAVRIFGQGMFSTARRSVGGILYGVDPDVEDSEINIYIANLTEGTALTSGDDGGALVGEVFAEKLGLKVGRKIVYTVVDREGELASEVSHVRGLYRTGVDDVDGSVVVLPIQRVRRLLGYGAKDATLVSIYLDDHRAADRLVDEVEGILKQEDVAVASWATTQPELAGMVELDHGMNQIFQLFIGVLIAAGVLNTLLMSVLERHREFGIMMALGTSPSLLFRLVLFESALLALVGLALGSVALVPWFWYLSQVGIDTTSMTGSDLGVAGVLVDPVLRATIYGESMLAIGAGVFVLTLVAGLYPAWRAGRQAPMEVMKAL